MSMFKNSLAFFIVNALLVTTGIRKPFAEARSPAVHFGFEYRSVHTHFSDYSYYNYTNFGYYTINTWEDFSLFGIGGDMLWSKPFSHQLSVDFGFGLALFFLGGYAYEVGMYTGSGNTNIGFELDLPARIKYRISDNLNGFGRLGVSVLFLGFSTPEDPPPYYSSVFYGEGFFESLVDFHMGFGADYMFTPSWVASLMLRFALFPISGSATYGEYPALESLRNFGVSVRLVRRLGR